jgi:hypothetical protein
MKLFFLIQKLNLEEKIQNAPDSNYQIGVLIGSFVPFVFLVGIAYWMYSRAKKRDKIE